MLLGSVRRASILPTDISAPNNGGFPLVYISVGISLRAWCSDSPSGLDIYSLSRIKGIGPVLWTSGAFGPEAGLIVLPSVIGDIRAQSIVNFKGVTAYSGRVMRHAWRLVWKIQPALDMIQRRSDLCLLEENVKKVSQARVYSIKHPSNYREELR